MLNESVSRDKAIVQLNHLLSDWDDDWNIAIRKCIETIKNLPSVTAQPKMGRWIKDKCSICGEERAWYGQNPPYCPDCGSYNGGDTE
jgi:hypothetical protein